MRRLYFIIGPTDDACVFPMAHFSANPRCRIFSSLRKYLFLQLPLLYPSQQCVVLRFGRSVAAHMEVVVTRSEACAWVDDLLIRCRSSWEIQYPFVRLSLMITPASQSSSYGTYPLTVPLSEYVGTRKTTLSSPVPRAGWRRMTNSGGVHTPSTFSIVCVFYAEPCRLARHR